MEISSERLADWFPRLNGFLTQYNFVVHAEGADDYGHATLRNELLQVPQLTWDRDLLPFIHQRFYEYRMEKRSHPQWDEDAKGLFRAVLDARHDLPTFVSLVRIDPSAESA